MMDFLKAYPFITMEQYFWELSMPMIKVMAYDATKVIYLSGKEAKKNKHKNAVKKAQRIDDPMQLMADTGIPVFNDNKK